MKRFLKEYWVLILAALLAVGLVAGWYIYPSIRRGACGFAIAAVVIIGLVSAARVYLSIYRD